MAIRYSINITFEINVMAARQLGKGRGDGYESLILISRIFPSQALFYPMEKAIKRISLPSIGRSPAPCQAERMGWRRQGLEFCIPKGALSVFTSKLTKFSNLKLVPEFS